VFLLGDGSLPIFSQKEEVILLNVENPKLQITEEILLSLKHHGFFEFARSSASALRPLRDLIRTMRPLNIRVDRLRTLDTTVARSNSLSGKYGTGAFPAHTDFALRNIPPRYIALFCPVARPAATTLFNADHIRASVADTGTFRITESGKSYSACFNNISRWGKFYRYNADLMKPLDEPAEHLATIIALAPPDHRVNWQKISWVIFDNWSILHGRQAVEGSTGWLWRLALETQA
jgi:hypothetical protein